MRRGAPFSMGSTVRDDPRRFGHLRDALYAFRMTEKILAPLGTANSISRGLGAPVGSRVSEIARDRAGGSRSS